MFKNIALSIHLTICKIGRNQLTKLCLLAYPKDWHEELGEQIACPALVGHLRLMVRRGKSYSLI